MAITPTSIKNTSKTADNNTELNFNDISNGINEYVVSPLINLGIAGFVFSQKKDISISLNSDITEHFVEDNSTIQNNIALKPITITLSGVVAEKEFLKQEKGTLQSITETVAIVNSFIPVVSQGVKQAKTLFEAGQKNKGSWLDFAKQNKNNAIDIYGAFRSALIPTTKQAKAYNFFYALWQAKQLVSLETPYRFFSKMAIQDVSITQPSESESYSDVSITLKQIRTAEIKTSKIDPSKYKSATKSYAEQSKPVNNGITKGKKENVSAYKQGWRKLLDISQ